MTFDFYSFRFVFSALDPILFPPGQPGNILARRVRQSPSAELFVPRIVPARASAHRGILRLRAHLRAGSSAERTQRPSRIAPAHSSFAPRTWMEKPFSPGSDSGSTFTCSRPGIRRSSLSRRPSRDWRRRVWDPSAAVRIWHRWSSVRSRLRSRRNPSGSASSCASKFVTPTELKSRRSISEAAGVRDTCSREPAIASAPCARCTAPGPSISTFARWANAPPQSG